MRNSENIRNADSLDFDWMGFIFYPESKRHVAQMPSYMPQRKKIIGVFVNATIEEIVHKQKEYHLHGIQLHGDESPVFCEKLRTALRQNGNSVSLIKAFGIAASDDLKQTENYENHCDFFLFDTKGQQRGGNGKAFDWKLIDEYTGETPFLLSGGIGPENAEQIKTVMLHPRFAGVDINSKFETAPAVKDIEKLKSFILKIRNHE